ncbi:MAG: glycosyltransferase [Ferruginibacter sp.]
MKTVFITIPWFHPAYKAGGPIQSIANLVNNFTEAVEYRIFCSNTDLDKMPMANIETGKWVPYNSHTQVWYAGTHKRSEILLEEVKKIRPDILYIIGLYDWHFNMVPLLFCKTLKKIVSVRGMLHPGAMSQKAFKKKIYLAGWKVFGLQHKTAFHATDEKEKMHISKMFGKQVIIYTAANFPRVFKMQDGVFKTIGNLKLISIALISPMKNHLQVLQALAGCTNIIEYNIYGPVKDKGYWQLCVALIEKLPPNIKAVYHGDLPPDQVERTLNESQVFILPSKSENFGHAIYEAFSAGLPVITSKTTPWNGLMEKQAGINTETEVAAITDAIDYFGNMENEEYVKWRAGAAAFANTELDSFAIRTAYREMFSILPDTMKTT